MRTRINLSFAELEHNPRYQHVALGLITLLAALLRFYKLGAWSFWLDEIYTIGHAQAHYGSLEATIRNIPPSRNWVPISVILTAGTLNALGTSEWSARLVAAVIGVVSIPLLYFPVRRLFSPGVGLIAALLLAVSPWHIYWSQNTRFFTSLMLLYSLALLAFFFGLERDRPGHFLLSIFLLYLAASERLYGAFLVPVVVFYLLGLKIVPFEKPPGLRARNLVLIALPGIAFGMFEIYSFVTTGSSIIVYAASAFAGQANHSPLRLLASIVYRLDIPLVCLGVFGGLYLLARRSRPGLFFLVGAVLPPILLVALSPFAFTLDRYVFATLPFWATLAAKAVEEMLVGCQRHRRLLALAVLVLLVASSLGQDMLYFAFQNGNRPDWRSAFEIVRQRKADQDLVFATRPEMGTHYLDKEVKSIHAIDPDTIVSSGQRAWFVIDVATSRVEPTLQRWIQKNCEFIEILEVYLPGKSMSIRVYLYDPAKS